MNPETKATLAEALAEEIAQIDESLRQVGRDEDNLSVRRCDLEARKRRCRDEIAALTPGRREGDRG
jgi:hypothetical protein